MVDGRVFKKRTMLEKLKILLSTDQSNKLYILFSLLVLILILGTNYYYFFIEAEI